MKCSMVNYLEHRISGRVLRFERLFRLDRRLDLRRIGISALVWDRLLGWRLGYLERIELPSWKDVFDVYCSKGSGDREENQLDYMYIDD